MVVYLLLAAVKPVNNNLHQRSSTEVKLILATAGVGILTQDGFPLPVWIEHSEIEPEPVKCLSSMKAYYQKRLIVYGQNLDKIWKCL